MFRITRHSLVAIACLGFLPLRPENPDHPVPRAQLSPEGRALLAAPKGFEVSQEAKLLLVAPSLALSPDGKALVHTKVNFFHGGAVGFSLSPDGKALVHTKSRN